MPHYDYQCEQCGHVFEIFQNITEDPLKECPKCKGPIKRLLSTGAGLIFKGSGFYITDYKYNKNKASTESTGEDKKPEGDSKTNKTDKKQSSSDKKSK